MKQQPSHPRGECMPLLSRGEPHDPRQAALRPVTLVLYAPFGDDATLSRYPGGSSLALEAHPLFKSLADVAGHGVNVCALIDRVDDDSWLLEARAFGPLRKRSVWKQHMGSPRALAGLLTHVAARHPGTALVLAMEGHGAGYVPEMDMSRLGAEDITRNGTQSLSWSLRGDLAGGTTVQDPTGAPLLPMGCPMLPMGCPMLPGGQLPLSTWGIGHALALAVDPLRTHRCSLEVIHFNNCFNMSLELLHTVAPYAAFAAAYNNYNFFSAGRAYPSVFAQLKAAGHADGGQLATWFSEANRSALAALPQPHPTVGGVVALRRLPAISAALDQLSLALIAALPARRAEIAKAVKAAQQYDTGASFELDVPDSLTDVASLAAALRDGAFDPSVSAAAGHLAQSCQGIKVYGERGKPWVAPDETWDFSASSLAMNIYLPDPNLEGLYDWRAPFYLQKVPGAMPAQPRVIDFLAQTHWVDFLIKYHDATPFKGLKAVRVPEFPVAVFPEDPRDPVVEKPPRGGRVSATAV
jgi:hypothetical protein